MIIKLLMSLVLAIFSVLLAFQIPQLPPDVTGYIETFFSYLEMGASILSNYTPLGYLLVLFGIILAVDAGIMIYHFVMWVIKKIPFLGMQ